MALAMDDLTGILRNYNKGDRRDLIQILQDIQGRYGYLSAEAMRQVADHLRIPESTVYSVATFYSQFKFVRQGKHTIKVCLGTACHVRGGPRILETVERELGIRPGQTTPDYEFSLERVACFGSCALGPVVVIDGKVCGRMAPDRVKQALDELR